MGLQYFEHQCVESKDNGGTWAIGVIVLKRVL